MTDGLNGQCHCGKNTFTVNGKSEFQFICYCKDCQILSSGARLCAIMFDDSVLSAASNTQTYIYAGGSGEPIIMHFCPGCSTQLYAYPTAHPGKVVVKVNALVDADFKPQQSLFTESARAWDNVP